MLARRFWSASRSGVAALSLALLTFGSAWAQAPAPLLAKGQPSVAWWFAFKFNTASAPMCSGGTDTRACLFGGTKQPYPKSEGFSQQFIFASPNQPLKEGSGCVGDTTTDPLGATFDQVYNADAPYFFVIWNDQFYDAPNIAGCTKECGSPWGHSKGMVAWNQAGQGFVLQVSTPSWPAAGNKKHPRNEKKDGNTLGCVLDDDVEVSQHFFALKINKDDLIKILNALENASVVTDPKDPQLVNNGGPSDVQALVAKLGNEAKDAKEILVQELSSQDPPTKITLISKPSGKHVPPWQMVSSELGGISLLAATWWAKPEIPTTTDSTEVKCWDPHLKKPGAVTIATGGTWKGKAIGLKGGAGKNFNHAKIGASMSGSDPYAIFGDMNQQGSLSGPNCASSQNGRGGLFYVVRNQMLHDGVKDLITGETAH
jgi:hypothetical protein